MNCQPLCLPARLSVLPKKAGATGTSSIGVLAKIESADSVTNLDSILDAADGAMVARGDLGAELPVEEVLSSQPASLPACLPAYLPACLPACPPACLPACLGAPVGLWKLCIRSNTACAPWAPATWIGTGTQRRSGATTMQSVGLLCSACAREGTKSSL